MLTTVIKTAGRTAARVAAPNARASLLTGQRALSTAAPLTQLSEEETMFKDTGAFVYNCRSRRS